MNQPKYLKQIVTMLAKDFRRKGAEEMVNFQCTSQGNKFVGYKGLWTRLFARKLFKTQRNAKNLW